MNDIRDDNELLRSQRFTVLQQSIRIVTDEKLSWTQIKKRVAQGDITYIIALNIAKRKIEELENRKNTKKATRFTRIYEATHLISHALLIIYLGLSFFQKPSWCLGTPPSPEGNSYYDDCTGTEKEGTVIPVSNIPYLKTWQLIMIEVICVTCLTVRRYIKQVAKKYTTNLLFYTMLGVTVLVYISEVLQYGVGIRFPLNQLIRPFYLILYSRDVRANLRFYGKIVWKSKEIFIVIAGIFLFFVCLAKVIFYQTAQNAPISGPITFDTFWNTMYNLFVGMTTSNYPDLMMPIYSESRFSSIYFIVFMLLMYFILFNIILAYFYYNYKEELISEVRVFNRKSSAVLDSLFGVDTAGPSQIFSPSSGGEDDDTWLYKEVQKVHQGEIAKLFEQAKWKRALLETLELPTLKAIFAFGSIMSFIFLVIQSCVVSPQPQPTYSPEELEFNEKFNTTWMYVQLFLNVFLMIDPVLRAIAIGWKYFIDLWFHLFELSLSIAIIAILITKLQFYEGLPMIIVRVILIFRAARFFKWTVSFEKYNLIYDTLIKLVPLFMDLLGILTIAFYLYSTLGEVLFGGYLKTNLPINFSQYGNPNYYVYVNFNDFAMGLFTCVHLLVVNNWLYTVDVHCRTLDSFKYRIFFVSFFIIVVVICLNIMIAFILDLYVTQMAAKNKKTQDSDTAKLADDGKFHLIEKEIENETADPKHLQRSPLVDEDESPFRKEKKQN